MSKTTIHTDKAPQAIGTYSQAVNHQGLVFVSGQIPLDPDRAWKWLVGGIEAQIHRVFKNLSAVCTAAGGSLDDIVKLTVFLTDMDQFSTGQRHHGAVFHSTLPGTRCCWRGCTSQGVQKSKWTPY